MIGILLGNRYRILEKIGEGGMAVVYKARCTLLNRIVAVKVLRPQYASDAEFVQRFEQEAQSAASLCHPNVVNIYDVGRDGEYYYIVMEYIQGKSLKDLLDESKVIEVGEALWIATQILQALDHAHRNNIIHRDIKPHNIMVTRDGRVKVTDFGIARTNGASNLTETGTVIGTVNYFSPEQAKGEKIGRHSDIYSLGIVLYEMLTGMVPFRGESAISVALRHIQEAPKPLREIREDIPEEVERIVMKALAKEIKDRYNTAGEMLWDIRPVLSSIESGRGVNIKRDGYPDEDGHILVTATEEQVRDEEAHSVREGDDGDTLAQTRVMGRIEGKDLDKTIIRGTKENGNATPADKPGRRGKQNPFGGFEGVLGVLRSRQIAVIMLLFVIIGISAAWITKSLSPVPEVSMPNFVGLTIEEAERLADETGLKLDISRKVHDDQFPAGHIVSQAINPSRMVKVGSRIHLTVSLGKEVISVPDLTGMTRRELEVALANLELVVGEVTVDYHDTIEAGRVIRQNPEPGSEAVSGDSVDVVMSKGKPPFIVSIPDLKGLTLEDAKIQLKVLQLNLGKVEERYGTFTEANRIIEQSPEPGSMVEPGSTVNVVIAGENHRGSASGDTSGRLVEKEFTITYPVIGGPSQQIIDIVVIDYWGRKIVHHGIHSPGDFIEERVTAYGEVEVQIWIDGTLVRRQTR